MFNFKIRYLDKNIIVINKPIGITIKELINLNYLYFNNKIPNFGILNRLDKYTSGLILIAKNLFFYFYFKKLIIKNLIKKNYISFINEKINKGFINVDIFKKKKSLIIKNSKKSVTYYKIIKKKKYFSFLNICIKTGRTHQIRLHLLHIKKKIFNEFYYNKIVLLNNTLHFKKIMFYYPFLKKKINLFCNLNYDIKRIFLFNFLK
ncbi:pseudouridine synthase [Candidatus Carsonella ruddii]|uniref:Ribosomal large subunit pseudouridine synthase n=1 Tax=Candidatus Carsonella ruddii PC isolate NHV TaxID=1202540 RepID=J3TWK7_CARRU|nr:pseudouridine synthase [Candidatus Carsonella ruddii]AFP84355.1 ribosomal large subunit pseudouridine synthase [Candidatus Carsonella ruddii PC isolate NHV]